MTVKLTTESIRIIALFEKITNVHAKDCIVTDSTVYFLVDPKMIGLAIGKNGSNIKEMRKILNRNIKIYGYSKNPEELIRNMIPSAKSIDFNNGSVIVSIPAKDKTVVIGRNGENIKAMKMIMKRHLKIERLKLR